MATIQIEATPRATVGTSSAKALRRTGRVPAVIYGHGGPTVSVAISLADIQKALAEHAQTFELSLEGKKDTVLLLDAQFDLSGEYVTHVDFKRVAADVLVEVDIEVRLKGTPVGEKFGGRLDHIAHAIKVTCLPGAIPELLTANVEGLELGDVLRAGEIALPPGVSLAEDPEEAVAACHHPGGESDEDGGAEGEAGEGMPEVIGKSGDADAGDDGESDDEGGE